MTKSVIVKENSNALATQNLAYLVDASKENSTPEALKSENFVTYLTLLQDLSPQCKSTKPEYIPEAKGGMLLNSLTNEVVECPINVVVLNVEKKHTEWKPNRGGFVKTWDTYDFEKGFDTGALKYVEGVGVQTLQGNIVESRYEYTLFVLNRPDWGRCKLSLLGGNMRAAKRWNFLLTHKLLPGTTLFAATHTLVWTLNAELIRNDKGEWYTVNPVFTDFVTQEMLQVTSSMAKESRETKVLASSNEPVENEDF